MVELKSPPHFFYAGSGDDEMGNKSLSPLSVIPPLLDLSQACPSTFGQVMLSSRLSLPFLPLTGSA